MPAFFAFPFIDGQPKRSNYEISPRIAMLTCELRLAQHAEELALRVEGREDKVKRVFGIAVLAVRHEQLVDQVLAVLMPHVALVVTVKHQRLPKLHCLGQTVVTVL